MVEAVPEPVLARQHQRRQHTECDRHGEHRIDDEDRRPGHRQIREWQQDLRPVDREAVEERVGDEREERKDQPASLERACPGVDADRRPGDDRRREHERRDRMAVAAVPGEGGDGVGERPQDVEVREEPAEPSPQRCPPPDLASEGRFPHGGAEGDLGNGVHGARSAHAGVGRIRACSSGICTPRVSSPRRSGSPLGRVPRAVVEGGVQRLRQPIADFVSRRRRARIRSGSGPVAASPRRERHGSGSELHVHPRESAGDPAGASSAVCVHRMPAIPTSLRSPANMPPVSTRSPTRAWRSRCRTLSRTTRTRSLWRIPRCVLPGPPSFCDPAPPAAVSPDLRPPRNPVRPCASRSARR